MHKLFLILALFAFAPHSSQASPCETYEPNCDGVYEDDGGWDGGEPTRPADPDGPDYVGGDHEI
jgi:hypothetical protein